jgi:hypothetical protein
MLCGHAVTLLQPPAEKSSNTAKKRQRIAAPQHAKYPRKGIKVYTQLAVRLPAN